MLIKKKELLKKMNKRIVMAIFTSLLFVSVIFSAMPVAGVNTLPSRSELSISATALNYWNDDYSMKDVKIDGSDIDLDFFKLLKDDTYLDLSASTFESDVNYISTYPEYSKTFINSTWNTAVTVNVTATSNFAIGAGEVTGSAIYTEGSSHTPTTSTAYNRMDAYFDENRDGDYVDSGDKAYIPMSKEVYFLVTAKIDSTVTTNATYLDTKLAFETTSGTDYVIHIKQFVTSGNSGWDLTTSNGATLNIYDTDGTSITTIVPVAEIISEETESVTSFKGFDYCDVYVNLLNTAEVATVTYKNVGVFNNWPSLDDRNDDDDDRDWNSSGNIFANPWDDETLLQTTTVEAATDTHDNTMPLNKNYESVLELLTNARYIQFENVVAVDPTTASASSVYISPGKYFTTETMSFDLTGIDDYDTFTNVLTASNWQYNFTLDDSILWDTVDYEENLYYFYIDSLNKYSTFLSAFEASGLDDQSEVQFDFSDPSTTSGHVYYMTVKYYTDQSLNVEMTTTTTIAAGGIAPTGTTTDYSFELVLGVIALCAFGVGIYLWKRD
jgi:hypothetical protein